MTDNELFAKHAQSYLLCYNDKCPTRKQCLRWIIKDHTPEDMPVVSIVNPRYAKTTDNECPYFKSNKKQKMAVGMTLFFDEMPRKTEQSVRNALINDLGRTKFFTYRRGAIPIPPAIQEHIRAVCEACGWDKKPVYDGFTEEYEW